MPSFDIISKTDVQLLDNAVNTALKEIKNRFDFKDIFIEIKLDKKENTIKIESESEMKIKQIEDVIISKANKQQISLYSFDLSEKVHSSGKNVHKKIIIRNGLEQVDSKKIVQFIKEQQLKVQAAILDDLIRVTAKKIDDLQQLISIIKQENFELPLQFVNFK